MKKLSLLLLAVYLPVVLFSEQFIYSGNDLRQLKSSHLIRESMIQRDTQWYRGVTLLELLPLMEEIYSITIKTDKDRYVLDDDKLAEYWSESYFLEDSNTISLIINGEAYDHVREIQYSGTPMESDNLEIWLSWEGITELKEELNLFARFHNIEINSIEVPRPESKLISVVRAGGDVPDIIMLQSSSIENLIAAKAIQNLNYLQIPPLMEQGKKAFTVDNKIWALPFYSDAQVMFYNKDIVEDSINLNWTLEDMERIARKVQTDSHYDLVWNAYSSNWLIPFQFSYGKTELVDSDGTISVNDNPTERALSYVLELQNMGLLSPMERDAMDALFIAGKVAFIMSGSYAIPYFESLGLNFAVLPFPINQETGYPVAPLLDFKGLSITKKADSPILARRFIQYLTSPAVQQRFCPPMAKLPSRNDVLEIPGISYNYSNVLNKASERGIVIPPLNIYSVYKNNMWKLLRFALSGKMSVRQTLEQGQTLMDNTTDN